MKKIILSIMLFAIILSCKEENKDVVKVVEKSTEPVEKSIKEQKEALLAKGFELFDYVDEKTQDTVIMQKYFIAFLKKGPNRSQPEEEANKLQAAHMAHLGKMYELGYADISGPFEDDSDISGITIYNVPTLQMADSLANADPMVKAGRLVIEMHPWWAAKGFSLR